MGDPVENLRDLWPQLNDLERDIVGAALYLSAALNDAPDEWREWVLDMLRGRWADADALRPFERAIEHWSDERLTGGAPDAPGASRKA